MDSTAIFFDMGETLELETLCHKQRADAVEAICKRHGISVSSRALLAAQEEAATAGALSPYAQAVAGLGLPAPVLKDIRSGAAWKNELLFLNPDTEPVLRALSRKHRLGILANQSAPIEGRLKSYGIRDYISWVICSCDVGAKKPEERIFRLAQEAAKGQADAFWMVGDRVDNDIVPAKRLGWKTVRLLSGPHRRYQPKNDAERADHEISCLIELANLL